MPPAKLVFVKSVSFHSRFIIGSHLYSKLKVSQQVLSSSNVTQIRYVAIVSLQFGEMPNSNVEPAEGLMIFVITLPSG